jgi:hypothetical protein
MEDAILDTMLFLEDLDFLMVFRVFGLGLFVFWLVVIGWAAIDASERLESKWLRLLSVLLVILIPIFGLLIYLTVRPRETLEEAKWTGAERRYLKFETAGLYDCPSCGYEVFPNHIFCPNCGYELRFKCESCDVYLEPEWNTCPYCGEEQSRVKPDIFGQIEPKTKEKSEEKDEGERLPAVQPSPAVLRAAKPRSRPKRKGLFGAPMEKKGEKKEETEKVMKEGKDMKEAHAGQSKKSLEKSPGEKAQPKRKEKFRTRLHGGWKAALGRVDEAVKKVGSVPLSFVDKRRDLEKKEK